MPGSDLRWYGTTGPSGAADGGSQPNPALWLGRFRASQTVHSLLSTLTASQTDQSRHYLVDSSQIGAGVQAHRLKWVALLTGPNAGAAARVAAFDTLTGTYKLDRPLAPSNAATGNSYALFTPAAVFPHVTAQQALDGDERFRCIVLKNQHSATITGVRLYFRDLGSAGLVHFARAHQVQQLGGPFLSRTSEFQDPLTPLGQPDPTAGSHLFIGGGPWRTPFGYVPAAPSVGDPSQINTIFTTVAGIGCAIWLRRRIPAGTQSRRSVAVQLIAETTTAGSDPNPLTSSCVIAYDVGGEDSSPEVEADRFVGIGGGARLVGRIRRAGVPESGRSARWVLRPGDAGALYTDDDPFSGYATSDEDGVVAATYHAPELEALAGDSAAAQLVLPSGDELGDPQPRIALAAQTTFGFNVSADLTLPSSTETFDEDPGAGFWPAG